MPQRLRPTPPASPALVAAVEGGGTKFLCAVGHAPGAWIARHRIPTTEDAGATLRTVAEWLRPHRPAALGVACFGPLDVRSGHLLQTPKPGWSGIPVVRLLLEALGAALPAAVTTDVTAAAVAEARLGAARPATSKRAGAGEREHDAAPPWDEEALVAYVTVGTGIGAGLALGGRPLHGMLHPEIGHLMAEPAPGDDFPGICPFHGRCLEGMASGPALRARYGVPPEQLPAEAPAWRLVGHYVAQVLAALVLAVSPHRIVLGGGVGRRPEVLRAARRALYRRLGGYVGPLRSLERIDDYVVPARFTDAGLQGAALLALERLG